MVDSSTGGYLLPAPAPAPLQGPALNDFLQEFFVGITGLANTMVRPSFQGEPPVIPQAATVWMAFRYETRPTDLWSYIDTAGNFQRHEDIHVLCSFYDTGVDGLADTYLAILRDGLEVDQNLEVLSLNFMGLRDMGDPTTVPVLVKSQWQYRVDLPLRITREVERSYAIQPVKTANVQLEAQTSNGKLITKTITTPTGA
jgi:hypothetical protein